MILYPIYLLKVPYSLKKNLRKQETKKIYSLQADGATMLNRPPFCIPSPTLIPTNQNHKNSFRKLLDIKP